ncbi:MAG: glycosyltransferase family 2 protein [Planctomycetota bacterium]
MSRPDQSATLEVVIPFYNEERVLDLLIGRLAEVFSPEALERYGLKSARFLMVDDGSTDRSPEIVAGHIRRGFPAVLYRLSRNFGHQNAVSAGMHAAGADAVAVMDADLQDPPEVVLQMVGKWRQGHDVVHAIRKNRKDGIIKRMGCWFFYRMVRFLAEVKVPLDSGDFCLMDRKVVDAIRELPEKLRFPRALRAWVGYRQTTVAYDRPERRAGRTKYTFSKLYRLATDGVAALSTRPLRMAQIFSMSFFLLSCVCLVLLVLAPILYEQYAIPVHILIVYFLIVLGNGVLTFCIYILGAYIGRTYLEVKRRPSYLIMETVRGEESASGGPEGPDASGTA